MSAMTASDPLTPLPESVPVTLPELPPVLEITTHAQMKALGDAVRTAITRLIQYQPLTAKQMADRLEMSPGTVGHHLHVLERAGLVQVVARRLVRGTVAKYYARTARMYGFAANEATNAAPPIELTMATECRQEIAATLAQADDATVCLSFFPHAVIAPERIDYFYARLDALVHEFLAEPPTPTGTLMGLGAFLYTAPPLLQPGNRESEAELPTSGPEA